MPEWRTKAYSFDIEAYRVHAPSLVRSLLPDNTLLSATFRVGSKEEVTGTVTHTRELPGAPRNDSQHYVSIEGTTKEGFGRLYRDVNDALKPVASDSSEEKMKGLMRISEPLTKTYVSNVARRYLQQFPVDLPDVYFRGIPLSFTHNHKIMADHVEVHKKG